MTSGETYRSSVVTGSFALVASCSRYAVASSTPTITSRRRPSSPAPTEKQTTSTPRKVHSGVPVAGRKAYTASDAQEARTIASGARVRRAIAPTAIAASSSVHGWTTPGCCDSVAIAAATSSAAMARSSAGTGRLQFHGRWARSAIAM
jgi:hypothetical protein